MDSPADTIAATATAPGEAALAVVRMSGPESRVIAGKFLRSSSRGPMPALSPRRAHLCLVVDESGQPVEEAIVVWYPQPHSFTGEETLEITVHGGLLPPRMVLEQCLRNGARLAQPGEFTLRAFLKGRLDLAQAESVIETIQAQTRAGLRLAQRQRSGAVSSRIQEVRATALGVLAQVEAAIDFPEDVDEPDREKLAAELGAASGQAQRLSDEARAGQIYRDGIRLAIVGRPNVGKSSLLNALLRDERAIVTPVPGTTRDTIEESIAIGGVPVRAIDTAGIRRTEDLVEKLGVERALSAIRSADLCMVVLDRSESLLPPDLDVLEQSFGTPTVVVINKCDLPPRWQPSVDDDVLQLDGRQFLLSSWPFPPPLVAAAAATGEGIHRVEDAVLDVVFRGRVLPADGLDGGNVRHAAALERAGASLSQAQETAMSGAVLDLISIDVRGALSALGEITGETASEDLLHEIFSRFCIGK